MRPIDADALIEDFEHDIAIDEDILGYEGSDLQTRENAQYDKDCKQNAIDWLMRTPTIKNRCIKYYDEDENVWKIGEVIVNSSEKPNNSTISKMEQVETMSCAECKHRPIGAEICEEPCHYEPQTDWHYDEQDATWYPYKHEDEPQQKSCATCKHALGNWDGESNNCGRCCGADRRFYEPKDEPQTERSE